MLHPGLDAHILNVVVLAHVVILFLVSLTVYAMIIRRAPNWLISLNLALVVFLFLRGIAEVTPLDDTAALLLSIVALMVLSWVAWMGTYIAPVFSVLAVMWVPTRLVDGVANQLYIGIGFFVGILLIALIFKYKLGIPFSEIGATVLSSFGLYFFGSYIVRKEYENMHLALSRLVRDPRCKECWGDVTAFLLLVAFRLLLLYLETRRRRRDRQMIVAHSKTTRSKRNEGEGEGGGEGERDEENLVELKEEERGRDRDLDSDADIDADELAVETDERELEKEARA